MKNLKIFLKTTTIFLITFAFYFLPFLIKAQTTTEPLPEEPPLLEEPLPEILPEPLLLITPLNNSFLNCQWFNAVDFQGNEPITKQDQWQFRNATCSSAVVEEVNATNSSSSFFLIKGWDYGELLITFLLVIFLFLLIFILIFNFFFEPVFKIRGKQ